jgi:DNA-binding transcriptional LysR family regulator
MLNEIDLSRTDLNLLVLFEAVLAERHVGRAAARLNLSPSAVSHGLSRLRRLFNDPLFMRTPKGVAPSERAIEMAGPVGEILARVRAVVAASGPFDPATSRRRFTIGAPDGVSAVLLTPLLAALSRAGPGIDVSIRQLLPMQGETASERAWAGAFSELETRALDIAIIPSDDVPKRFHQPVLFEEDFVVATRADHPFAASPTLEAYRAAQHLVVSVTGDPHGFVDQALAEHGLARRTAVTAPNFMFALALLADTDLVSALPRRFTAMHGPRFGVTGVEPPLRLPRFQLRAVAPRAAMADAGLAWLFALLAASVEAT